MATAEDYANCEQENDNLRAALAWVAAKLPRADQDALEQRLDQTLEAGGVTGLTSEDERQEMVQLLRKLVAHLEPLLWNPPGPSTKQPIWFARLETLLSDARHYEPKHPLMQRVGGHPNVFAPVRKPV